MNVSRFYAISYIVSNPFAKLADEPAYVFSLTYILVVLETFYSISLLNCLSYFKKINLNKINFTESLYFLDYKISLSNIFEVY